MLPDDKRAGMARAIELAREIELRRGDPLLAAYQGLTPAQKSFIHSKAPKRIAEGGNRSGKTWTAIIDRLLQARGLHPVRHWAGVERADWMTWAGWFGAVSYPLFGLQGWMHYKRLLLYPGESEHKLPTRNIIDIGWNRKNPQIPDYVRIRRSDCEKHSEEWIKSFEQGAGAFQSGAPDCLGMDEEAPEDVYRECTLRVLDRDANMIFSATPLQGAVYLSNLRKNAKSDPKRVFHVRLPTRDNPSLSKAALAEIAAELGNDPDMVNLRLEGHPLALQGLVYNDIRFRDEHVCDVFPIPGDWTRYEFIDPGYSHCAALWFAVSPKEDHIVCYRDYLGAARTIGENARQILTLRGNEQIERTWFDRYYILKHESVGGETIQSHWSKAGVKGFPSVDIGVLPAIQQVWVLLSQRGGVNGARPRFQVFRQTCPNFLNERQSYKWPEAREHGDERRTENPVKRNDHVMDCWKGGIACGLRWIMPRRAAPTAGSVRDLIESDRRNLQARTIGNDRL